MRGFEGAVVVLAGLVAVTCATPQTARKAWLMLDGAARIKNCCDGLGGGARLSLIA